MREGSLVIGCECKKCYRVNRLNDPERGSVIPRHCEHCGNPFDNRRYLEKLYSRMSIVYLSDNGQVTQEETEKKNA